MSKPNLFRVAGRDPRTGEFWLNIVTSDAMAALQHAHTAYPNGTVNNVETHGEVDAIDLPADDAPPSAAREVGKTPGGIPIIAEEGADTAAVIEAACEHERLAASRLPGTDAAVIERLSALLVATMHCKTRAALLDVIAEGGRLVDAWRVSPADAPIAATVALEPDLVRLGNEIGDVTLGHATPGTVRHALLDLAARRARRNDASGAACAVNSYLALASESPCPLPVPRAPRQPGPGEVIGHDGLVRPGIETEVAGCPSNECQIRRMCTRPGSVGCAWTPRKPERGSALLSFLLTLAATALIVLGAGMAWSCSGVARTVKQAGGIAVDCTADTLAAGAEEYAGQVRDAFVACGADADCLSDKLGALAKEAGRDVIGCAATRFVLDARGVMPVDSSAWTTARTERFDGATFEIEARR